VAFIQQITKFAPKHISTVEYFSQILRALVAKEKLTGTITFYCARKLTYYVIRLQTWAHLHRLQGGASDL